MFRYPLASSVCINCSNCSLHCWTFQEKIVFFGIHRAGLCTHTLYKQTHTHNANRKRTCTCRETYNGRAYITTYRPTFITRRSSCNFAEYWKYFVARFNDVHAFGYNSAGSERIWMKLGALQVYCLELALADFGRDPRRSESGSASRNFVVFLSGK